MLPTASVVLTYNAVHKQMNPTANHQGNTPDISTELCIAYIACKAASGPMSRWSVPLQKYGLTNISMPVNTKPFSHFFSMVRIVRMIA